MILFVRLLNKPTKALPLRGSHIRGTTSQLLQFSVRWVTETWVCKPIAFFCTLATSHRGSSLLCLFSATPHPWHTQFLPVYQWWTVSGAGNGYTDRGETLCWPSADTQGMWHKWLLFITCSTLESRSPSHRPGTHCPRCCTNRTKGHYLPQNA